MERNIFWLTYTHGVGWPYASHTCLITESV